MSVGAQIAINALQAWCLALKQLLLVQQQELLSHQQSFDKQPQRHQQKDRNPSHLQTKPINESGQLIQGIHADDDQDSTISHLMQALPPKQGTMHLSSHHADDFMDLNEGYDEFEDLQAGESEEFEEDLDDLIEDRNTP